MGEMNRVNGIPQLGFGTFPLKGEEAYRAVRMAIDVGFRHIDTAQMYGNEADIGRAVRSSGLPREAFYVVTKIDPGNVDADRFMPSLRQSLDALDSDIDLLLIHWPPEGAEFDAAIDRLIGARDRGHARAIGVSNFSPKMMRRAFERSGGSIVNNQVEFHPLLDQSALLAEARKLGVALSAYSPLARGAALRPDSVRAIAQRHGRPAADIVLRWIVQQGVVAIPMTTRRDNAASNFGVLDFALDDADMAAISALGTRQGRIISPNWMAGRWDD